MSGGLGENQLVSSETKGQLNDIKGYWTQDGYNFNDRDMWEGQIVLYEDGWFEGIVNDPHSSYTADRFVFGAYSPDNFIELLKVTPSDVSDPFIFRGKRNAKGYDGEISVIGLFGEEPFGVNHIITQVSENQDATELQARIDVWKKSIVGDDNSFLYENTVQMRSQFCEVLRKNYFGQIFSPEEIAEIAEVTDPINEQAIKQGEEYVKKLVQEYISLDADNLF